MSSLTRFPVQLVYAAPRLVCRVRDVDLLVSLGDREDTGAVVQQVDNLSVVYISRVSLEVC